MHPVHNFTLCFLKVYSNIIFPSAPRSPKFSLPFRFSFILLYFIALMMMMMMTMIQYYRWVLSFLIPKPTPPKLPVPTWEEPVTPRDRKATGMRK
jgi:hypothetical protein